MKQHSAGFKTQRNSLLFMLSAFIFFTACNNNQKKEETEVKEDTTTAPAVDTTIPKGTDTLNKKMEQGDFLVSQYTLTGKQQDQLFALGVKQINFVFETVTNPGPVTKYVLKAYGTDGTLGDDDNMDGSELLTEVTGTEISYSSGVQHYKQRIYRGSLKTFYESGGYNTNEPIGSKYFSDILLTPAIRRDVNGDESIYFRVTPVTKKRNIVPIETKPSPPAHPCEEIMAGCDAPDETLKNKNMMKLKDKKKEK